MFLVCNVTREHFVTFHLLCPGGGMVTQGRERLGRHQKKKRGGRKGNVSNGEGGKELFQVVGMGNGCV